MSKPFLIAYKGLLLQLHRDSTVKELTHRLLFFTFFETPTYNDFLDHQVSLDSHLVAQLAKRNPNPELRKGKRLTYGKLCVRIPLAQYPYCDLADKIG